MNKKEARLIKVGDDILTEVTITSAGEVYSKTTSNIVFSTICVEMMCNDNWRAYVDIGLLHGAISARGDTAAGAVQALFDSAEEQKDICYCGGCSDCLETVSAFIECGRFDLLSMSKEGRLRTFLDYTCSFSQDVPYFGKDIMHKVRAYE